MEENKVEEPKKETTTTPTPPASASSASTSDKPKSKTGLIVTIIVVVVVALGVGGYFVSRFIARKAGEKLTEGLIKAGTGADVDVNTKGDGATVEGKDGSLSFGDSASWPKDMPSIVPEFKDGKITAAVSSDSGSKGWTVMYEKVEAGAFDKYGSTLVSAGWQKGDTANIDTVSSSSYSKDGYQLQGMYDSGSKGLTLTVTKSS